MTYGFSVLHASSNNGCGTAGPPSRVFDLSGRGSEALKSLVDELGPRLNAYLRSIGPVVAARDPKPPMTNDK